METYQRANLLDGVLFFELVDELLDRGSIGGCSSLRQMKAGKIAVKLYQSQLPDLNDCDQPRRMAGISLSLGMTLERLESELHDELIKRLHDELNLRLSTRGVRGRYSHLFDEIVNFKVL